MKKFLNIFAILVIATAFMACSDNENTYVDNSLKVVSSNVAFDCKGGNGYVEVDQAVVEAITAADWVSTKVEGNKVTFTVSPNKASRESRNAKLVIKSAQSSVIVAVSQYGYIFNAGNINEISLEGQATTYLLTVKSSDVPTIVECPEWVTATVVEEGISLAIAENTTKQPRSGKLVISAGDFQKTITINQKHIEDYKLFSNATYNDGFWYESPDDKWDVKIEYSPSQDLYRVLDMFDPGYPFYFKWNKETNIINATDEDGELLQMVPTSYDYQGNPIVAVTFGGTDQGDFKYIEEGGVKYFSLPFFWYVPGLGSFGIYECSLVLK